MIQEKTKVFKKELRTIPLSENNFPPASQITYKLAPNQVVIKDNDFGITWIFDINDTVELEFLEKQGKRDEYGNIVLSYPSIAALKRWTVEDAMKKAEDYTKELNVPKLSVNIIDDEPVKLSNLQNMTNSNLEELLSKFGGYRAYLETHVSYLTSKKGVLEATFEEGLAKMVFILSQKYDKRMQKEILHGEAIAINPQLKKIKQDLIETTAQLDQVAGLRDSFKVAFETVSRIVSLRISSREVI